MLSVVICTHNPRRDYFQRCLDGLKCQTLPYENWELIVIDNRSDEPVGSWVDPSWHPIARIVREEKLGLTPARLRGIHECKGDPLVFVDDDNVLDPAFLETTVKIAGEKQFLGAWSGQCRPEFEQPPPEWTRRYWGLLAIREFERDSWSNLPHLTETLPIGAGLCVRREVALHYLHLHDSGQRSFQTDRTGRLLFSCGDHDLAACACDVGLGTGSLAALKLTHLMRPERFTAEYLARLFEGTSYSGAIVNYFRGLRPVRRSALRRLVDFIRLMRLKEPHRGILKAESRGRARAAEYLSKQ